MSRPSLHLLAVSIGIATISLGASAQQAAVVTSADYARAESFLRDNVLPLVSGISVNNTAALTLDNSGAVNNDRVGIVNIGLAGASLNLIGNAGAAVAERIAAISTNDAGTIIARRQTSGVHPQLQPLGARCRQRS